MRILVGITGGIAAYKSATLVRNLTELGHDVKVLPTPNALRFIGSATLEALSHNAIDPDLYTQVSEVKHISLAQEAELVIVAPATAAFIARYASGLADDLLLNVLMATTAPVVIAPAMHSEMWLHPATTENINTLKSRGVAVLEPGVGRLTGSDSGVGRMLEPEEIIGSALAIKSRGRDLAGTKIVIAAGGTQEPIDDVRFIGNRSSGKQGIALATEAQARGAEVTLIAANIDIPIPSSIEVINVSNALEVEHELNKQFNCDVIMMPAAISDFRVENPIPGKLHRGEDSSFNLRLVSNPDILKGLVAKKAQADLPLIVGFAAESVSDESELLAKARAKLQSKGCEFLVANNVSRGAVFGSDDSSVVILSATGETSVAGSKTEIAKVVLDLVHSRLLTRG